MQRCPAVPTAPKTIARTAISRSAEGATIIALLPPSSRIGLPQRAITAGPTDAPIRVDPVAEITGTMRLSTSASPKAGPPMTSWASPSGASPNRASARSKIACVAKAVSGRSDLFLPVTGANRWRAAFAPSRAFMTSRASIASSRR